MKKNRMNWTVKMITLATVFGLLASPVWADPKFTVEDGIGNPVFTVHNDGSNVITGQDVNNAFSYKIIGHTGGNSHTSRN